MVSSMFSSTVGHSLEFAQGRRFVFLKPKKKKILKKEGGGWLGEVNSYRDSNGPRMFEIPLTACSSCPWPVETVQRFFVNPEKIL